MQKNIINTVNAFNEYNTIHDYKYKLILIGGTIDQLFQLDGGKHLNLKYVNVINRVSTTELLNHISKSRLMLAPYIYDGNTRIIIYAKALSIPVVTGPHPAEGILVSDGKSGISVKTNVCSILEGIKYCMSIGCVDEQIAIKTLNDYDDDLVKELEHDELKKAAAF